VLLAPDYALPLAASRRLRRPSERAFYPLKISCRGSALRSSGRTCFLPVPTSRLATGCTDYAYKTASGRSNFLNRDPIEEAGGINLYGFVNNDPANGYDVLGNEWASFIGGLSESTKKNEAAISVLANSPSTVLANIGLFGEMRLGGVSMVDPGCSDDEMSSLPGCSVESPYGMTIYSSNDRDTVNLIRSVSHWSLDNAEWTVLLAQNGSSSPRQSAAPNNSATSGTGSYLSLIGAGARIAGALINHDPVLRAYSTVVVGKVFGLAGEALTPAAESAEPLMAQPLQQQMAAEQQGFNLTFDTEHALPHFQGTGLSQADIEAQIESELQPQLQSSPTPTVQGPFMGRINFQGTTIEYRGFGLPNNQINIGTYYIPPSP